MHDDFKEKLERVANEYAEQHSTVDCFKENSHDEQAFKAGAKFAWDILSSSFDRIRKEDAGRHLGTIKVLSYERQLLQMLVTDYVDHFQIKDCQSCDPEVGFSCPECCQWQRCSDALATLGVRK